MTKVSEITSRAIADMIEYYKPAGGKIDQMEQDIAELSGKVDVNTVQLTEKATQSDLMNAVSPKAERTYVDGELAKKANQTDVIIKADKTYVDTQISAVASGSPKGVYASLSALQTAFPTGNTNIYLVTADGKWYYWNGSAWTAGGVYQAASFSTYKRQLTGSDNIDDFRTEGTYLVTVATSPGTYPAGVSPYVILEIEGTGSFYTQKITNTVSGGNSTRVWVRTWQTSWGVWTEISNIAFKTYKRSLIASDNIDTLFSEGQYWLNKATTTLGTFPVGLTTYSMLDVQSVGSNYVVQKLTNLESNTGTSREFIRSYNNSWTPWAETTIAASVTERDKLLTNLVSNGDFSNGFSSFYVGANITDEVVSNNTLTFTGVGYASSLPNTFQNNVKTVANHVYYLFATAKYTTTPGKIYMSIYQDFDTYDLTTEYTRYSSVLTATTGGYYSFTFAADTGVDVSTQYWGSIDLTEEFGAGNEPTKEYMDNLFSQFNNGWFNGNTNVLTADYFMKSSQEFFAASTRIPSNWLNAKASFVGDSITAGSYGNYVTKVKDRLGLSIANNYGVGGGRLAVTGDPAIDNAYIPLVRRYTNIALDSDIIFVLIGTNDYSSQIPIGPTTSTLETEFNGALNIIMDYFRDTFPDKLVIFSTLLHRYNDTQFAITMDMYRDAIRERCKAKHFVLYDAYLNTGFDFVKGYYDHVLTSDGLHPNERGSEILARKIAAFINVQ